MNIGAPWPTLIEAEARVLRMQTKLHQWARSDPDRRFDDLFNLVHDPATLVVAWRRVRGNKGKRSGGVDGIAPKLAKADLVPTETNLLGQYGTFGELEAACEVFCEQVNARVHRVTRRAPDEALAHERARLSTVR